MIRYERLDNIKAPEELRRTYGVNVVSTPKLLVYCNLRFQLRRATTCVYAAALPV